jgi:hypothetical protein
VVSQPPRRSAGSVPGPWLSLALPARLPGLSAPVSAASGAVVLPCVDFSSGEDDVLFEPPGTAGTHPQPPPVGVRDLGESLADHPRANTNDPLGVAKPLTSCVNDMSVRSSRDTEFSAGPP